MKSYCLNEGCNLKNGEYRIIRTLGQGGFGITYEAEQISLGRKVAIKEFFMKEYSAREADTFHVSTPSEVSREQVDRFRLKFIKEARLIASLNHPNIIRVQDVFEENGTAYYVMDYLPGESLKDKVEKEGPLSTGEIDTYIHQLCSALEYLHSDYILHLDVKPSNILFDKNDNVVLIDFGISKHYDENGEQTSSMPVGVSRGYAPIEQYTQSEVGKFTPATDIYSLGATLFYMVTGSNPPEANVVYNEGLPVLDTSCLPTNIRSTIIAAMKPRYAERPQSIPELLAIYDFIEQVDEVSSKYDILQLKAKDIKELQSIAKKIGIDFKKNTKKIDLEYDILDAQSYKERPIEKDTYDKTVVEVEKNVLDINKMPHKEIFEHIDKTTITLNTSYCVFKMLNKHRLFVYALIFLGLVVSRLSIIHLLHYYHIIGNRGPLADLSYNQLMPIFIIFVIATSLLLAISIYNIIFIKAERKLLAIKWKADIIKKYHYIKYFNDYFFHWNYDDYIPRFLQWWRSLLGALLGCLILSILPIIYFFMGFPLLSIVTIIEGVIAGASANWVADEGKYSWLVLDKKQKSLQNKSYMPKNLNQLDNYFKKILQPNQ